MIQASLADRLGDGPDEAGRAEARIRWAIRHETTGLLRRLVATSPIVDNERWIKVGEEVYCIHCQGQGEKEAVVVHGPDCPYVAAKIYLERFSDPGECPY